MTAKKKALVYRNTLSMLVYGSHFEDLSSSEQNRVKTYLIQYGDSVTSRQIGSIIDDFK